MQVKGAEQVPWPPWPHPSLHTGSHSISLDSFLDLVQPSQQPGWLTTLVTFSTLKTGTSFLLNTSLLKGWLRLKQNRQFCSSEKVTSARKLVLTGITSNFFS